MWRGVKGLVYVKGPASCLLFISALWMVCSSILATVRSCGPEGLGLVAFSHLCDQTLVKKQLDSRQRSF